MLLSILWPAPSDPWPGGITYFSHLVACLTRCVDVFVLIHATPSAEGIDELDSIAVRDRYAVVCAKDSDRLLRRVVMKLGVAASRRPRCDRGVKPDVFFAGVWETPPARTAWVSWIPDFQHLHLPSEFSQKEVERRNTTYAQALRRCRIMLLSSEDAKDDLASWAPQLQWKARVAPFVSVLPPRLLEIDPQLTLRKYRLAAPLMVVSNQWWTHKNHEFVVRAAARARERGRGWTWAFTGPMHDRRSPNQSSAVMQLISETGMRGQIAVLGMLPRVEQVALLRAASCVVQPSSFEGWSTIVEDCRALGSPLALSDIRVHREQAPRHSRLFSVGDQDALIDAVDSVLDQQREPASVSRLIEDMEARAQACGERFKEAFAEATTTSQSHAGALE